MQDSANPTGRRLATAALLGVGSALAMGATAHADGVTGAKVGNTELVGTVALKTVNSHGGHIELDANTGLMDLRTGTDSDDNLLQTYCIQLDTQLDHSELYDERNWSDLKPPIPDANLHEVWWVLDDSYPAVSLETLDDFAGDTGLTGNEAVEATQAAVWTLVDPSGETVLDTANPKNDANVVHLYTKLIAEAGLHKADPGTPQLSLAISPATISGAQPGTKVGPFKLASSDHTTRYVSLEFGTGADAPPAGSHIVDTTGAVIPASAKLKDGDEFWVTIPAGAAGGGHFTVLASGVIPMLDTGRVFMTHDGKVSQNLIVAGSSNAVVHAQADVSWTVAPPSPSSPSSSPSSSTPPSSTPSSTPPSVSTPPGGLARTGADNTVRYGEGALSLILAGAGVVLLTRRPAAGRSGTHR